jgi:signal transduction histidine kinase
LFEVWWPMRTMKQPRQNKTTRPTLKKQLTEVTRHREAISDVLRAMARWPHDLQPVFDAIIANARLLCRANIGGLRLSEEKGLRLVALCGVPDVLGQRYPPIIAERSSYVRRLAAGKSPIHIHDLAADEFYRQGLDSQIVDALDEIGVRTILIVALFKDEEVFGTFFLARTCVKPFTDKQIELVKDFAAQSAIALEIARREWESRQVQIELTHANRVATIGQLTASIAHELKQPLGAAVTNGHAGLRRLTRRPPEIEQARRSVEEMINDVRRASDVIDRIHSLVKKHGQRMEKLDINGTILEVVGLIQSEVVKNGITVRMELAQFLAHIHGDRVQLQQVILNLIMNAIQAMSDLPGCERELRVSTELIASEGVRVAVRDTGPGFSPEQLQRLFAPFYTTKPDGMGMGLSICQSIIEDHGGRLWATRHEPHGALFQFVIPAT